MSDDSAVTARHAYRAQLREFVVREVSEVVHHLAGTIETAALEQAEAAAQALVAKAREVVERQANEIERLLLDVTALRSEVDRLTADLQIERASTMGLRLQAEKAQYGRARAEDACAQAEAARHQLAVTLERELRDVRAELDLQTAEVARLVRLQQQDRAERARLTEALEHAETLSLPAQPVIRLDESVLADPVEHEPRSATVTPIRGNAESILAESATLVLAEVESRYMADVQTGLEPAQLVERLTVHLDHARSMYGRCLESVGGQDAHGFEHELARLIDRHGSTAFGRHLAVASYAGEKRAAAPRPLSSRAS